MKKLYAVLLLLSIFTGSSVAQTTPAHDAAMYKITLPAFSEFKSVIMTGIFRNSGTDTLYSVTINWRINDGQLQQLVKTDLSVSRNQTWPFTAPKEMVLNTEGSVVVKVWVSMPNGVQDEKASNDTLTHTIQVIEKYPVRHMLIEEVTGTWCGYCPRAPIIYRTNVQPAFPNTIFAAIHNGDGMTITESRDLQNTYVTGVPTGFVDRKKTLTGAGIDFAPEDWLGVLNNVDNRFTPVDLKVYNYYDPTTGFWKIDVVSDFVFDLTCSYRMNCYIIEDSLSGTGSNWDQRNFFNGGASEPYMSLQGAGDPIPGYKHHHVVRKMLGGSWGQAGTIPATVKRGDRYVFSQTFKADSKWKMANVHIVGIVQQWDTDKLKRPIINCVEGEVELLTGTNSTTFHPGFRVFPNPVSDLVWVEYTATENSNSQIQIINSLGQEIHSQAANHQPGTHTLSISMEDFTPGIYFIKLTNAKHVLVERVIKETL